VILVKIVIWLLLLTDGENRHKETGILWDKQKHHFKKMGC